MAANSEGHSGPDVFYVWFMYFVGLFFIISLLSSSFLLENNGLSLLLHKCDEIYVTIWENMATTECTFLCISVSLVREHREIQDDCHHSIRPR